MTRERRRTPRIRKRMRVDFGPDGLDHRGFTKDVSVDGFFVVSERLLELNKPVHIHLLTEHRDFYAEGRVARVYQVPAQLREIDRQGMGIRFVDPADLVQQIIPNHQREHHILVIKCSAQAHLEKLLTDQLAQGVLMAPVSKAKYAQGDMVEFEIELSFSAPTRTLPGVGRIVQLLELPGSPDKRGAVIDVKDVSALRHELAAALA